jgi:hypothetical protein
MEPSHERRKKYDKSKDKAGRPSQKYVRAVEALLATPKQVPVVTKKKGS